MYQRIFKILFALNSVAQDTVLDGNALLDLEPGDKS